MLFYLFIFFHFAVNAQEIKESIPKIVYTTKSIGTSKPPTINGLIEESVWDIVEWQGDFIERSPDENTEPAQQTKFKIIYDEKNLYLAFNPT